MIIVWKCGCEEYGKILKAEFIKGMEALHADSLTSLRNRLDHCRDIAADPSTKDIKLFFKWVFDFNRDYPATVLSLDTA